MKTSENVLQQPPKGLPEIYQTRLFQVVEDGQAGIVNKSPRWLAVVKCPRRLGELLEAMAIKLGDKFLQRDRLINRINGLISWYDNLVTLNDEDNLVQFKFIHPVKQFLLSKPYNTVV
jgi:hypothetical protein